MNRSFARGARSSAIAFAAICALEMTGCASVSPPESRIAKDAGVDRKATIERGMQDVRNGAYDAAIAEFNRALSREPENAGLHLLAGMAYHLSASNGSPGARDLAEVGYSVAADMAPSSAVAQLQLGRLHLEGRDYPRAQRAFARALQIERDDGQAAMGLAVASYYAGDLETALSAVGLAEKLRPSDRRVLFAAVVVRGAAGLDDEARATRARLQAAGEAPEDLRYLDRRVSQWQEVHRDARASGARAGDAAPLMLAQAPASASPPPATGPASPMSAHWADCGSGLPAGTVLGVNANVQNPGADETTPLAALPSPCANRPLPRMVQLDATYVRTEESVATTKGVNVLQGLQVVFNAARTFNLNATVGSSPTRTIVGTGSIGLPQAGVTYSLNIANAADLRADVLARPTLMALDRVPALFFSGTNLSIAIGGPLTPGTLVDKPVGVSMSVTPTLIDEDTLLLAVKISRSAVEEGQPGTFDQSLHTTRNIVSSTAILKFDQTLILSGLIERESVLSKQGIPGLRDVPLVQYATSTATTDEFRKSMLITITPRRVVTAGAGAASRNVPLDPVLEEVRERLRRDYGVPANSLSIMRSLNSNFHMTQFRQGDLKDDDWKAVASIDNVFRSVWRFLYY